jgi:hypothetical protein
MDSKLRGLGSFTFTLFIFSFSNWSVATARPTSNGTDSALHATKLDVLTDSKLINLTINWTIENFIFLLEEPELRSLSVTSADAGLEEADGDWLLILTPSATITGKTYVSLHLERANATIGSVIGRFGF